MDVERERKKKKKKRNEEMEVKEKRRRERENECVLLLSLLWILDPRVHFQGKERERGGRGVRRLNEFPCNSMATETRLTRSLADGLAWLAGRQARPANKQASSSSRWVFCFGFLPRYIFFVFYFLFLLHYLPSNGCWCCHDCRYFSCSHYCPCWCHLNRPN